MLFAIPPFRTDDAYYVPLKHPKIHREERDGLLERYAARYQVERDSAELPENDIE